MAKRRWYAAILGRSDLMQLQLLLYNALLNRYESRHGRITFPLVQMFACRWVDFCSVSR